MGNVDSSGRVKRIQTVQGGWGEKQEEPPVPSAVVVVVLAETSGGV